MKIADIEATLKELRSNIRRADIDSSEHIQPPKFIRPILSTIDTYDQNTQVEFLDGGFASGRRPIWNVPSVAVVAEKIATIKASATVSSVSPTLATQSGITISPQTASTSFTVVPNMAQVVRASGPVAVSFALNVQTVNANDPVSFAIYRDGIQVSQIYRGSGGANTDFHMAGQYTDNPPQGYHVYDVRWAKTTSTVTASGKNRTLQVSNLRAQ